MTDLLVLGSGGAGLSATIRARRAGLSVRVLTKGGIGWSATSYAQGGVAAALFDDDSPALHGSDTMTAGAGLCDPDAVEVLAGEGPRRVRELMAWGASFDRSDGTLHLAREGGHSVARVVHAGGAATGREIERALVAAALASGADIRERWHVLDLVVEHGRVAGVLARSPEGRTEVVRARHVLVATGGAGQCFAVTTNPLLSTGDGIAMALRAGVAVADIEFMQFHPTALHHPSMPRPLLSEALRGEGAVVRDDAGVAFMADEHHLADLAPRDVVARAITRRLIERDLDHLWLDATTIDDFAVHFPSIDAACRDAGLDPTRDWLPVAPAAHYLCGGICTDLDGASTLPGLWACGEAACTGVHGANRLASNSLLENLVFAARAVDAVISGREGPRPTGAMRSVLDEVAPPVTSFAPTDGPQNAPADEPCLDGTRDELQQAMTHDAGVVRSADSLRRVSGVLDGLAPTTLEDVNLLAVSRALVASAAAREESRGTHTRLDHLGTSDELLGRFVFAGEPAPVFVPLASDPSRDASVARPSRS